MSDSLAKKSFWGTFWSLIDTLASKLCVFVVGIVLARLLTPSDFGLVGMMTVFVALSDVFIESGFGNALVRKLNRTEHDLSTALYFNIFVAIFAYSFLVLAAPLIASFFNEPSLNTLVKYVGLNVVLYSLTIVPNSLLIAQFRMKSQARINLLSNMISGVIAICMAYRGFGVMALVWQTLILNGIKAVLFWKEAKWFPKTGMQLSSVKYLWGYGSKSLAIGLLGTFFNNLYNIFIGKFFSKVDLGYYSRANQFACFIPNTFNSVIQKVCIATFSNIQYDKAKLKDVYIKYINVMAFVIFPIMTLLALIAELMVMFLLTEKWRDCIPILQIMCVGLAFSPFGMLNLCLLNAINQVGYSLKLEIVKKALFVIIVLITFPLGILPLVIGSSVYNIIATFMNFSCSKKFMGYKYTNQIKDISVYLIPSVLIAGIVYLLSLLIESNIAKIIMMSLLYLFIYGVVMISLKTKAIPYMLELIKKVKL